MRTLLATTAVLTALSGGVGVASVSRSTETTMSTFSFTKFGKEKSERACAGSDEKGTI